MSTLTVTDNGDGTATLSGDLVIDDGDGTDTAPGVVTDGVATFVSSTGGLSWHTLNLNFADIEGDPLAGGTVYVSYDRTVRTPDMLVPNPASDGVAIPATGMASVQVLASDDPSLMADSAGFGINVRVVWTEAPSWRQQSKTYTAQVLTSDPASVNLSAVIADFIAPPTGFDLAGTMSRLGTAITTANDAANDAASAVATANTADGKADDAVTLAAGANASTDGAVAAYVTGSGATRSALDAAYATNATTRLGLPADAVMQAFGRDPVTGDWYATQARTVGGVESAYVYRCAADGSLLDWAMLDAAGHGVPFGIERDGGTTYLWLWWGSISKPVRWAYAGSAGGVTIEATDATVTRYTDFDAAVAAGNGRLFASFSVDIANDRIAVVTTNKNPTTGVITDTAVLRKFSEFKAGTNNVLATLPAFGWTALGALQGVATYGSNLYITRGGTASYPVPPAAFRYGWTDGTKGHADISKLSAGGADIASHNETQGAWVWTDATGSPTLLCGKATGPSSARIATVYAVPMAASSSAALNEFATGQPRMQGGILTITPTAGTPTSGTQQFPQPFANKPVVTANPISGSDAVQKLLITNITTTSFDAILTRTNTTATGIGWIAYDPS